MGTETLAGAARGAAKKRTARAPKLTFRQKAVLFAGIVVLGGVPGFLCASGSVQRSSEPLPAERQAAVMADRAKIPANACIPGIQAAEFQPPTMNIPARVKQ